MRVAVYCGSRPGRGDHYLAAARALGTELARQGLGLVYGGARHGLMGAVADGVLAGGGEAIGVMPLQLDRQEFPHHGLTRLEKVDGMHARKARMIELADAFIALPGGLGTLEELFEVWTWSAISIHHKPMGVLEVDGYWAPLLAALEGMEGEGFIDGGIRRRLIVESDASRLLGALQPPKP